MKSGIARQPAKPSFSCSSSHNPRPFLTFSVTSPSSEYESATLGPPTSSVLFGPCHVTVGRGRPHTRHVNTAVPPTSTTTLDRSCLNSGATSYRRSGFINCNSSIAVNTLCLENYTYFRLIPITCNTICRCTQSDYDTTLFRGVH